MSEKDGSVSEREDVSFNSFGQNMPRGFWVDGLNGVLVGKRLEAIHSPSARRYCIMSALSSICFREGLFFGCFGWRERVGWVLVCGEEFGEVCVYAGG